MMRHMITIGLLLALFGFTMGSTVKHTERYRWIRFMV